MSCGASCRYTFASSAPGTGYGPADRVVCCAGCGWPETLLAGGFKPLRRPANGDRAQARHGLRSRDRSDRRAGQGARDPHSARPGAAQRVPALPPPVDAGLAPARCHGHSCADSPCSTSFPRTRGAPAPARSSTACSMTSTSIAGRPRSGPDARAGKPGCRPGPGLCQHALDRRGPCAERLYIAVLGEVPHPRPARDDPARRSSTSLHWRGIMPIHNGSDFLE